ncbi:MAG TPA: hypothetical protein VF363_11275 [Candidatus Eisenbacteria bacterium]
MSDPSPPSGTDRRARARNLAGGARSLPEPLRAAFIERACAGDEELRREVDSLIAPPATTPPPPAAPSAAPPATPSAPPPAASEPLRAAWEMPPPLPAPARDSAAADWKPSPPYRPQVVAALFFAAAFIWLAGFALTLTRQTERLTEQRDRAVAAERLAREREDSARQEGAAAKEEGKSSREVADALAAALATPAPGATWRDRIAMRRLLDGTVASVRLDETLTPAARARLLEALAAAYRGQGLAAQADSLAAEAAGLP